MQRCQIHCLQEMSESLNLVGVLWQKRNRVRRVFKRRIRVVQSMLNDQSSRSSGRRCG